MRVNIFYGVRSYHLDVVGAAAECIEVSMLSDSVVDCEQMILIIESLLVSYAVRVKLLTY